MIWVSVTPGPVAPGLAAGDALGVTLAVDVVPGVAVPSFSSPPPQAAAREMTASTARSRTRGTAQTLPDDRPERIVFIAGPPMATLGDLEPFVRETYHEGRPSSMPLGVAND
jgi:hypothetical protein